MPHRSKLSAVAVEERPVVAMCAGKDCRKHCEFAKIRDELDAACDVVEMRCVGICNGPVVVTDVHTDAPQVFSKLRSKAQRRHLVRLAVEPRKVPKELRQRAVTGSKRKATLRKLDRALR